MSFFSKLAGVDELEKKVKKDINQIEGNLKTSWNWINYLHELEQDSRNKIKKLVEENKELKELLKNRKEADIPLPEGQSVEKKQEKVAVKVPEQKESNLKFKNIDISGIGKKEAFILQILYQLACFDASSSLETSKIHENLPYTITVRGLRKKLYKLQEQGVIGSAMYGNNRRWFLDMNKLNKLKQFLAKSTTA